MLEKIGSATESYVEEKDSNIVTDTGGVRDEARQMIFKAGQSKRIWNELYKVSWFSVYNHRNVVT